MHREDFQISQGKPEDVKILLSHRMKMFHEIKPNNGEYLPDFYQVTESWIARKIGDDNFIAFIARTADGKVAGSGCVLIKEDQPRPGSLNTDAPYLLSMYTEPEYRKKGVATLIIEESIKWAKANGYDRIDLHASPIGKALYEQFGFKQTNEMRLML